MVESKGVSAGEWRSVQWLGRELTPFQVGGRRVLWVARAPAFYGRSKSFSRVCPNKSIRLAESPARLFSSAPSTICMMRNKLYLVCCCMAAYMIDL